MMTDHIATDDPLLVLPRPKDVRAALSRRLREAEVLRRLSIMLVSRERNGLTRVPSRARLVPVVIPWGRKRPLTAAVPVVVMVAPAISESKPLSELHPLPEWPGWLWNAIDGLFPVDAAGRTIQPQASNRWTRFDRQWMPWSDDDAELVKWFKTHSDQLTADQFCLKPGVTVVDPSKFYLALEADIRAGANGVRAVGLCDDLKWLARCQFTPPL